MHRKDEDAIRSFVIAIEQQHPRPRPQYESSRCPPPTQRRTRERERFKNPQRADDPTPGVSGKVEFRDGLVHVPLRSRTDNYLRHSGQLVERNTFPAPRLGESLLGALPGAGNRIEDLRDAACIGVGIVKRGRKQRPRERSLLDVGSLREPGELTRVGFIQGDVDALRIGSHKLRIAQRYTGRASTTPIDRLLTPRLDSNQRPGRIGSSAGRRPRGRIWSARADPVQGVRLSSPESGTKFGAAFAGQV